MDLLTELGNSLLVGDPDPASIDDGAGTGGNAQLVLSAPERIERWHAAAVSAGSRILRTVTRNANQPFLEACGLGGHTNEVNWTAAKIAVTAAHGSKAYVLGSVGEITVTTTERRQIKELYKKQIGALLDGGAKGVILEGFRNLMHCSIAIEAKQELHHCPVLVTLDSGCPQSSNPAQFLEAARSLQDFGADFFGVHGLTLKSARALFESIQTEQGGYCLSPERDASCDSATFCREAFGLMTSGLVPLILGGKGVSMEDLSAITTLIRGEAETPDPSNRSEQA